jgi:uncharacterized hydrophobic protein (TIGR00271 family)
MIHLRAVIPPDETERLVGTLRANETVMNLVVVPGASAGPVGDAMEVDVLNGGANAVIGLLRDASGEEGGAVMLEQVNAVPSHAAERVERGQPRFQAFTPVWTLVDAQIRANGLYPPSWFSLLVIAGVIGAVGILTNSQILVVAAMVVGPEYGAITSMAQAGIRRDPRTFRRGLVALAIGFGAAIIACVALGLLIRGFGVTPKAFSLGVRPVSNLINSPNVFSVIVAVLAGIVGIISLTEARPSTLIGVFVSVTTIPAASDIGISVSYGLWSEAWGSLVQLVLNVSILVTVGMVMLVVQQRLWDRMTPVQK